jgi:hypothetical protein
MLQRIASTSIDQLMSFIAADRTGPTAAAAPAPGSALAGMFGDFPPEPAGQRPNPTILAVSASVR